MKELDDLAKAIVEAVALIIALPYRIVSWVVRAVRRKRSARKIEALRPSTLNGSKKSQKKVGLIAGSSLKSFKLDFEEVEQKRGRGGRNLPR